MKFACHSFVLVSFWTRRLTDNAIRLVREANKIAINCHDTWKFQDHKNHFKFTNPVVAVYQQFYLIMQSKCHVPVRCTLKTILFVLK